MGAHRAMPVCAAGLESQQPQGRSPKTQASHQASSMLIQDTGYSSLFSRHV